MGSAVVALAACGALIAATGADLVAADTAMFAAVLVGAVCGAAIGFHRFEFLVLGVVALAPVAELFSGDRPTGDLAIDPASVLGWGFLGCASVWLIVQRISENWVPTTLACRAMGFYVVIAALSIGYAYSRVHALAGVLRLLVGVTMFAVLEQLLARDRGAMARRLVAAVATASIVPVLVGYQQLIREAPVDPSGEVRLVGPFAHPSTFASFLVIVGLVALAAAPAQSPGLLRFGLRAMPLLVVPLLVGTGTRVSWAAFLLGVLYIFRRHIVWLGPTVAASGAAAFMFMPVLQERFAEHSLSWRVTYWEMLIDRGRDHPWTGWGWDQTQVVPYEVTRFPSEFTAPPHNMFVRSFVELGLPGLLALVVGVTGIWWVLRSRGRHESSTPELRAYHSAGVAVLGALGVQALTENVLTAPAIHWTVLAAASWGLGRAVDENAGRMLPARSQR